MLSIIIPVFNKFSLTRGCLESLQQHSPTVDYEVIVVDNGSSDETPDELDSCGNSLFPGKFHTIRLDENRNFGPACNVGALASKGAYLFFLNNDTVVTPDWSRPLLDEMKDGVGMAGPLLVYPDSTSPYGERVQHLGVACMPQLHPTHLYEFFPAQHPVTKKQRVLQCITGAAMLLPREVFFEAGMFCEEYINGGEDLDLCVQVRKCGHSIVSAPESRIYHLQSQTPGRHLHEKHNAQVLKKRCLKDLYPDFHYHVEKDGYELALNEHVLPYAKLPERRLRVVQRVFLRESDLPDEDACLEMMSREPLFFPAYERLAEIMQTSGAQHRLVSIRFLQTRLFPSRRSGERLVHAAARAGDAVMEQEGKRICDFYSKLESEDLVGMARDMVEYSKHLNLPSLETAYTAWIEANNAKTR